VPDARPIRRGALVLAAALALAGCASANKTVTVSSMQSSSADAGGSMAGMSMAAPSRDSNGGTVTETKVGGLKVVPTTVLASTIWQGMRITAQARSALPFVVYNGTSEQEVKPGPNASFHLMVMLTDSQTGVAIPYASVWATISRGSRIVYDERQWPMISRYMGPHYGNNVDLPSSGLYHLTLLVSPPVAARHLEYKGLWLKPHRVNMEFRWVPKT
jgi:hypothetical protein